MTGTTVVATDSEGRLVVLHTERHCDDLPEAIPLVEEELADHLGLGHTELRFTRVTDGQSFWFDDAPDRPSTPNALARKLAAATRVSADCSLVDEIVVGDLVPPPAGVAEALRAELDAAWRAVVRLQAPAEVEVASGSEDDEPADPEPPVADPGGDAEVAGYVLMRAGLFLGFEGRAWAPFDDVMPDASDDDRASYVRALSAAVAALPPDTREIFHARQISAWADTATVAEIQARFGRDLATIAAIEGTARDALREAGTAWRRSRG